MRSFYQVLAIGAIVLFSFSCKKHPGASPAPQDAHIHLDSIVYLLKPGVLLETDHFFYNADNYVIKINTLQYDNTLNNLVISSSVDSFVYNGQHQLVSSYGYDATTVAKGRNDFFYDNEGRVVKVNVMWYPPEVEQYSVFTYYPGNKVASATSYSNSGNVGSITQFSYNGDNLSYRIDSSIASHKSVRHSYDTYDDKHSFGPLLKGMNLGTYDHQEIYSLNNCVKSTYVNENETGTTNYEYNSDGYPVKAFGTDTIQGGSTRYYYTHY